MVEHTGVRLPPLPGIPELLRGRALAMVEAAYLGDALAGAALIRPLRAPGPELDTFATIPASALDTLGALAGPDADTPLLSIEVRHLGGALARQAPGGAAQSRIDADYALFATGFSPTPELGDAVRAHAHVLIDALSMWHADHDSKPSRRRRRHRHPTSVW